MVTSERSLQIGCVTWFRLQYPKIKIWATPNGGSRNAREAVNLKREGVLSGVPDLFIAKSSAKYHGLFIELKFGKNGIQNSQKEMLKYLNENGYLSVVCRSFEEFQEIVNEYLRE